MGFMGLQKVKRGPVDFRSSKLRVGGVTDNYSGVTRLAQSRPGLDFL